MFDKEALQKLERVSVNKQSESNAADQEDHRKGIAVFKKLNR